ncbi:MAG TPA: hypothetical protein VFS21_21060 [Roseiflexaceae bacterium]|nr:hypothetical protein [Roseiflexaceae bacterium]
MKLAIAGIVMPLFCAYLIFWGLRISMEDQRRLHEQSATFNRTIQGVVTAKQHDSLFAVYYEYHPPESQGLDTVIDGFAYVDQITYDSAEVDGPVTVLYNTDNFFISNIKGNQFDQVIEQRHRLYLAVLGAFVFVSFLSACYLFEIIKGRVRR